MTLISICQQVADEVGLPRPSAIVTGQDQLARQMFALARTVLEDLCTMDWPVLEIPYDFPTVVGQDKYDLPNDFLRQVSDTGYVSSQYYALRGALTPAQWQGQKNTMPASLGRFRYRIFGNPLKFNVSPVPQTVEQMTFEYVTSNRVRKQDNANAADYMNDTDTSLVPELLVRKGLKWRIKHAKGLDYTEDFNDFEMSKGTLFAQQLVLGAIPVALRPLVDDAELPGLWIPETGYGA